MIDDTEEYEVKNALNQNWKGVKLQIRALKLLLTMEYDKVFILSSILFISTVIIYVLIGPDYFNLQGRSFEMAQMVINSTQIFLLLV